MFPLITPTIYYSLQTQSTLRFITFSTFIFYFISVLPILIITHIGKLCHFSFQPYQSCCLPYYISNCTNILVPISHIDQRPYIMAIQLLTFMFIEHPVALIYYHAATSSIASQSLRNYSPQSFLPAKNNDFINSFITLIIPS